MKELLKQLTTKHLRKLSYYLLLNVKFDDELNDLLYPYTPIDGYAELDSLINKELKERKK